MTESDLVPNHHAHYPGFSGVMGLVAALSMTTGREGDARFAARLSALGAQDAVLDIGCGPGAAVRYAARHAARVTGVDPAPIMLRIARLLTRRRDTRYVSGTAEALPVPDGSASVVWSIATVHHWADLDVAGQEILRVLRPGGRFVAIERRTEPGAHGLANHGWTDAQAEAFAQHCRGLGFVDVAVAHDTTKRRSTVAVTAIRP